MSSPPQTCTRTVSVSCRRLPRSSSGLTKAFFKAGENRTKLTVEIPQPRLWTLQDPYLHQWTLSVSSDRIQGYFGMRTISVRKLPGTEHSYVALNNQPVYLQLALDQTYHPDSYCAFPSDAFIKNELERTKAIGLNDKRYLHRAFKESFGETPRQYRVRHKHRTSPDSDA